MPDEVLAAAAEGDAQTKRAQSCEASFYLGEEALLGKRQRDAADLFAEAISSCPVGTPEYAAAQAELKQPTAAVASH